MFVRRELANRYSSIMPAPAVPVRRSSKKPSTRKTSSSISPASSLGQLRRMSGSTISWVQCAAEFEGSLGEVHISGERILEEGASVAAAAMIQDQQERHSDDRLSRNRSWGYVDPAKLDEDSGLHDVIFERVEADGDSDPMSQVDDCCEDGNGKGGASEDLEAPSGGDSSSAVGDDLAAKSEDQPCRDVNLSDDLAEADVDLCEESPDVDAVVARGHWLEALQTMQEYENEAASKRSRSAGRSIGRSIGRSVGRSIGRSFMTRSSRKSSGSSSYLRYPEGYVDTELMEACKLAMMSSNVLESRRKRSGGAGSALSRALVALPGAGRLRRFRAELPRQHRLW